MYKIIILSIILFSCSKSGQINVDFTQNATITELNPTGLVTSCKLLISGEVNCEVKIRIDGEKHFMLEPGNINIEKRYEWYNERKSINVYHENCSVENNLIIEYYFSSSYFGQKN